MHDNMKQTSGVCLQIFSWMIILSLTGLLGRDLDVPASPVSAVMVITRHQLDICSPGRGSTRHTTTLGCLNIHMDTVRNTQNLESQESCLLATFDENTYSYTL